MSTEADIVKMNMEAAIAVGHLFCSVGGHAFNQPHIEYWMKQTAAARAEITKLRAERDVAVLAERERCKKSVRNTICNISWPPEDGDQLIDELQTGIALFATDQKGGAT